MSIVNPYLEKHRQENNATSSAEDARLKKRVTTLSVVIASILILTKLYAYITVESVSVLSSLMDSTLDVIVSLITLLSVRAAMEPADSMHRFGHGKLEPLAALGQSFFIGASAVFLLFEACLRFAKPVQIVEPDVGIAVMVLSIVLTICLVFYQGYVVRKTGSLAIQADSLHYKGDLLMNVGVIVALLLSQYTNVPYFDPAFAVIVAIILFKSAYDIGVGSVDILMDHELPAEDRARIKAIVKSHKAAHHIHDLRTRSSGTQIFIEFHLEMDGGQSLKQAHDITEEIELSLYHAFPTAEVMIHQEPAGIDDDRLEG